MTATANIFIDNIEAVTAPTVNDDIRGGFSVGSRWFDNSLQMAYMCLDASQEAAVWTLISDNRSLIEHNDTSGLQGGTTDEYYHLTSDEYTVVGNTSGTNTGDQDLSGLVPYTGADQNVDLGSYDLSTTGNIVGNIDAYNIIIPSGIGSPSYDDLKDFLDMTQASGRLSGGVLSAHAGPNGTIDISEMEGMIHTTTTLGSDYIYFKQEAYSGLELIDGVTNFIWATYDSGSIVYSANTTRPTDDYNVFVIGRGFRRGNGVSVITTGQNIYNEYGRIQDRLLTKYGVMDHSSGAIISEHATPLRLSCTAGVWYTGNTQHTTDAIDTFYVWYKDGSSTWLRSAEMTLFTDIFDGGSATVRNSYQNGDNLATNNKYGVYWIFMSPTSNMAVVLGESKYTNIGAAQAATVPADLPPTMDGWGLLIGRVICYATGSSFYSVESSFNTQFILSSVVDHASLGNLAYADSGHTGFAPALGDDENYVTDAQLVVIGNTSNTNTGDDPGLENVEEDTTPTLGGNLDLAGFVFTNSTGLLELQTSGVDGNLRVYGSGGGAEYVQITHDSSHSYLKSNTGNLVLFTDSGVVQFADDVTGDAGKTVSFDPDGDSKHIFGKVAIGYNGSFADYACLGHLDYMASGGYAVTQDTGGTTIVRSGGELYFQAGGANNIASVATTGINPGADDTFYLGKNDDDTPFAWKGLILHDQTDGKTYRLELNSGAITIVDLTD